MASGNSSNVPSQLEEVAEATKNIPVLGQLPPTIRLGILALLAFGGLLVILQCLHVIDILPFCKKEENQE